MLYGLYYNFVSVFFVYIPEVMGSKMKNASSGIGSLAFCMGNYALLLINKNISDYKSLLKI